MLDFYVGHDATYTMWQTIARYLGSEHLASIRAVCRMAKKAVDDAVTAITVSADTIESALPERGRFLACTRYIFMDASEALPPYVRRYCNPPLDRDGVLICGEACWRNLRLQEWLQTCKDQLSWVGLVLRLCEMHQDEDLSVYLQDVLAANPGVQLSLLGLWCGVRKFYTIGSWKCNLPVQALKCQLMQREERIVLGTDIRWAQAVAETHCIEQLYTEYVHIDLAVLQDCVALNHLHLVFDEWTYSNLQSISAIETLRIVCLEADLTEIMDPEVLYQLGPHIHILRVLGGAAAKSFVDLSDWRRFLFEVFDNLISLECFETTEDAGALVCAASAQSGQQEQEGSCANMIIWRFWHLYIVVDRHTSMLMAILRSKSSVCLLHTRSEK